MIKSAMARRGSDRGAAIDAAAVLGALPDPVLVVDAAGALLYANAAAEQFFDAGTFTLLGAPLAELLPADSPVFALIDSVRASGHSVSEYGVTLETPRLGAHVMTVQAAPIAENRAEVVVTLQERSMAHKIDRQLTHRNAARSVTAMAAMLAHEVKNPLSGIRGAAQLLEDSVGRRRPRADAPDLRRDRPHLRAGRPHGGVLRPPAARARAGQYPRGAGAGAQLSAQNGFARHVRFVEDYDPSLPPVLGNRDQLVQVFLNLVKNAAEAAPTQGGEIELSTAYQQGCALPSPAATPASTCRWWSPSSTTARAFPRICGRISSIPSSPSKQNGTGLGLALVAKIDRRSWRRDRVGQPAAAHGVPRLPADGERRDGAVEPMTKPPPSSSPTTTAPSAPC